MWLIDFLRFMFVSFFEIAKSILNLYLKLPHNLPDIFKIAMKQTTILSNISWINDLLFLTVSGLSLLAPFIIASRFNISSEIKSVLSLFVYIISVWMFSQVCFWIALAVFVVLIISCGIYTIYKNFRGDENYV